MTLAEGRDGGGAQSSINSVNLEVTIVVSGLMIGRCGIVLIEMCRSD